MLSAHHIGNLLVLLTLSYQGQAVLNANEVTAYHGEDRTWDESKQFCEQLGGKLLTANTSQKTSDIFSKWTQLTEEYYWIGLHLQTSNCKQNVYWADGQPRGSYTNWDLSHEPDKCGTDRCIRVSKHGGWRTTQCNELHPFICETFPSSCTYDVMLNTKPDPYSYPDDALSLLTPGDVASCQNNCEASSIEDRSCWGVVIEPGQTNTCTLFFTSVAGTLYNNNNLKTNKIGFTLYRRKCFEKYVVMLPLPLVTTDYTTAITTHKATSANMPTTTTTAQQTTTVENDEPSTTGNSDRLTSLPTSDGTVQITTSENQHQTTIRESTHAVTTETMRKPITTDSEELTTSSGDFESTTTNMHKVEINVLVKEIKVEPKSTNAALRRRTSIMETRTSVVSIGIVSAILITCILGSIFISDIPLLFRHMKFFWCNGDTV